MRVKRDISVSKDKKTLSWKAKDKSSGRRSKDANDLKVIVCSIVFIVLIHYCED